MPKINREYPYVQTEITRHGKTVHYFRRQLPGNREAPRYRLYGEPGSKEFLENYKIALTGERPPYYKGHTAKERERRVAVSSSLRLGITRAKTRAKERGIPFDLTLEWAVRTVRDNKFRCQMTSIPFTFDKEDGTRARPFAPSFDRIDTTGGYTMENVRVVVFAYNLMVADWGDDVFAKVANGFRYTKKRIPSPTSNAP